MKKNKENQAWESWYKHHPKKSKPGRIFSKRREFYLKFISSIKNKSTLNILDIGCGEGETLHDIKHSHHAKYYKFYGVDITKDVLVSAKKKNQNANFMCADAFKLPFKDKSLDIIMCTDLLHHLTGESRSKSKRNVERAIKEMTRICSDEGYIIIMEECVKWKVSSYLVFLATYFCSLLNSNITYMEIHKGIIISFLTPKELYEMLINSGIKTIIQGEDDKKVDHILSPFLRTTWVKLAGQTQQQLEKCYSK